MLEERKMILEMLAEKKITAEQAAELLRALGTGAAVPAGEDEQPGGPEAPVPPEAPTPPAGPASSELGAADSVEERQHGHTGHIGHAHGRSILEDFLSQLNVDWSSLPFMFGGEAYRFEEEQHGEFAPGQDRVNLDLEAANGRVEVLGWDRPGWRVFLRKKVRAASEAQARERAVEIARLEASPSGLFFRERTAGWNNAGVSAEVWVPRGREYDVRAHSSNGRVVVEDLNCGQLVAETANGKVSVRGVRARSAELSTTNGSIVFAGAARPVSCRTANGSVTFCPLSGTDGTAELHTGNGSIRIWLAEESETGYAIQAQSGFGGLTVDLPRFEVRYEEKQFGRKSLRGETAGFASKAHKWSIGAKTTNGSVRVLVRGPDDPCKPDEDDARERWARDRQTHEPGAPAAEKTEPPEHEAREHGRDESERSSEPRDAGEQVGRPEGRPTEPAV
jgi:hypothetical protein